MGSCCTLLLVELEREKSYKQVSRRALAYRQGEWSSPTLPCDSEAAWERSQRPERARRRNEGHPVVTDKSPGHSIPAVVVKSLNRTWFEIVEEAMVQTWFNAGYLKETWIRGAEAADDVNLAIKTGDLPHNARACAPDMTEFVTHVCAQGGRYLPCQPLMTKKNVL
ncbi:hypothetical protein LX36DRAFT_373537 [Colletotrichum falcatum]|nr:hypothetical protein LX36DRAFT_373537 [Colletotrichum falcatum]